MNSDLPGIEKKETIILDAFIESVIGQSAFRARLKNGHRIVAFLRGRENRSASPVNVNSTVQVSMSPYDMSKGLILTENFEVTHESQKFS